MTSHKLIEVSGGEWIIVFPTWFFGNSRELMDWRKKHPVFSFELFVFQVLDVGQTAQEGVDSEIKMGLVISVATNLRFTKFKLT